MPNAPPMVSIDKMLRLSAAATIPDTKQILATQNFANHGTDLRATVAVRDGQACRALSQIAHGHQISLRFGGH